METQNNQPVRIGQNNKPMWTYPQLKEIGSGQLKCVHEFKKTLMIHKEKLQIS